jgi:uncharacterized membrane protein YdjX (TVP38/TMEM64 family)
LARPGEAEATLPVTATLERDPAAGGGPQGEHGRQNRAAGRDAPAAGEQTRWGAALGRGALLLGGLVAAGFALRFVGLQPPSVRPSPMGAAMLIVTGALLTAVGVPRQAVAFAGGYGFGVAEGVALALTAQIIGCAADFWWARAVARDWAVRRLHGRMARLDRVLAARPFTATLTLRLLPVGNNTLLNLFAGASGLRPAPFLLASLAGYLPQTIIFALAGSGVQIGRGVKLGIAAALFAASAGLGAYLLRRGGPVRA